MIPKEIPVQNPKLIVDFQHPHKTRKEKNIQMEATIYNLVCKWRHKGCNKVL